MDRKTIFSIGLNQDNIGQFKNKEASSKNFHLKLKNSFQHVSIEILWAFIRCLYLKKKSLSMSYKTRSSPN